jgi:uncharacterized repeat protein (TIGR03803 family)
MTVTNALHHSRFAVLKSVTTFLLAAMFGLVLSYQPASAQTYTVLRYFVGTDGSSPQPALIRDSAGNLYGVTLYGGDPSCYNGCGTIFKIDSTGAMSTLYSFRGSSDGYQPYESLLLDSVGNLYGTSTYGGHGAPCGNSGGACGTTYKLSPSGTLTVMHTFSDTPDGATPPPGHLVTDSHGNQYGTTAYGGSKGYGTVYQINAAGREKILYNFGTFSTDGNTPLAGLVVDVANHALYGTTEFGGNCPYGGILGFGCGTVYKLDSSGETQLYVFTGAQDGASPNQSLVRDAAGNLYGTAEEGGDLNCSIAGPLRPASAALRPSRPPMEQGPPGCGVVFKVDPNTHQETVLYRFTGGADGSFPASGVILDPAGNIYGAASEGGDANCNPPYGCGTIFKIDTNGNFSILHAFTGPDGASPEWGSLLLDSVGNLYGTTSAGGANNNGVVFKITP